VIEGSVEGTELRWTLMGFDTGWPADQPPGVVASRPPA
jgi:hypothetical protein